jgi:hypothetical protein
MGNRLKRIRLYHTVTLPRENSNVVFWLVTLCSVQGEELVTLYEYMHVARKFIIRHTGKGEETEPSSGQWAQ